MEQKNLTSTDIKNDINEYKHFAFNKNMLQVAVAFIMGTAFQKTVNAISDYFIMPIVNYFVGQADGNWRNMVIHPVEGMNIEIGHLIGAFIDFIILTFVLYILYCKAIKWIVPDLAPDIGTQTNPQPIIVQPVPTNITPEKEIIYIIFDNKDIKII